MYQMKLSNKRRFFFLVATFLPMLFALRWVAAKFPISSFDCWTSTAYIKPGKSALFVETYRERHRYDYLRIFVLDFENALMNEIRCPPELGRMWNEVSGIDVNGNVICRSRSDDRHNYASCDPKSGESRLIHSMDSGRKAVLVGNHGCLSITSN